MFKGARDKKNKKLLSEIKSKTESLSNYVESEETKFNLARQFKVFCNYLYNGDKSVIKSDSYFTLWAEYYLNSLKNSPRDRLNETLEHVRQKMESQSVGRVKKSGYRPAKKGLFGRLIEKIGRGFKLNKRKGPIGQEREGATEKYHNNFSNGAEDLLKKAATKAAAEKPEAEMTEAEGAKPETGASQNAAKAREEKPAAEMTEAESAKPETGASQNLAKAREEKPAAEMTEAEGAKPAKSAGQNAVKAPAEKHEEQVEAQMGGE